MREEVLTDQLWERLEPLLPVHPRRFRYPGRKRADDRAALEGWSPLGQVSDVPTAGMGRVGWGPERLSKELLDPLLKATDEGSQ